MSTMAGISIGFVLGAIVGAAIAFVVSAARHRRDRETMQALFEQTQQTHQERFQSALEQLKTEFSSLSRKALSENTNEFLKLADLRLEKQSSQGEQQLDSKKKLIDARLDEMGQKLSDLNKLIQTTERQRSESHGVLKTQIERTTQATHRLTDTTSQLREALAHPQRRGQWGERMAEDVLRLAGLIEGINYARQKQLKGGTRPDFTFMLPGERCVHMDVKFPLSNYLKVLDANDDHARQVATGLFLRDVRTRIKEVTTRDYIDPAGGTVDYVLVFIPNEQVYNFIHEHDAQLLDDAMRQKVVLCSPLTLYAILAVIRRAMDNFHLEQNSKQILELLAEFKKQWAKYTEGMDTMGKRLESAMKEYQQLSGLRTQKLDRQLDKIEDLRAARLESTAEQPSTSPPPAELPSPLEA